MIQNQYLTQFGNEHTCQVFKLKEDKTIEAAACGCVFLDSKTGRKILLTVNHLFDSIIDSDNFGVFTDISEKGKALLSTKPLHAICVLNSAEKNFGQIDLRFREVSNTESFYTYECTREDGNLVNKILCKPFTSLAIPYISEKYYFVGRTSPQQILYENEFGENSIIEGYEQCFEQIEFCGEYETFLLKFCLPKYKQIKRNFYQGCSGAPIFNEKEELVSILVKGEEDGLYFYGIDIAKLLPAIISSLQYRIQ